MILVDKPKSYTSHDIVAKIRQTIGFQKVGHFGTLDPLATGLLIIGTGKATRFFPFFSKLDKTYKGRLRFGYATDTYDSEGRPISPEINNFPDKNILLREIKTFTGDFFQKPPPFSAKKIEGQRLYMLARKKKPIKLAPSSVTVKAFEVTDYSPPFLDFIVDCSSGTYIRSLAHDLGQHLNCGAHLTELRRINVGSFHINDAYSPDEIEAFHQKGHVERFLKPIESLLTEYPKIILKESSLNLARNGNKISPGDISSLDKHSQSSGENIQNPNNIFRIFSPGGEFIALARNDYTKTFLHPFLVINNKKPESNIETKRKK